MKNLIDLQQLFSDLKSKDDKVRYPAFKELIAETETEVTWVYEWWYDLEEKLKSGNSFQRNIGLILLANLSKSDKENRLGGIIDYYLTFFEDEKFITARQCIQNVWKIAVSHEVNRKKIIDSLEKIYYENNSPHPNLIKQDAVSSLFKIYEATNDKSLLEKIKVLIESELDEKLKKTLLKSFSK